MQSVITLVASSGYDVEASWAQVPTRGIWERTLVVPPKAVAKRTEHLQGLPLQIPPGPGLELDLFVQMEG